MNVYLPLVLSSLTEVLKKGGGQWERKGTLSEKRYLTNKKGGFQR